MLRRRPISPEDTALDPGADECRDHRRDELARWLAGLAGLGDGSLTPASGDASFRRYFRYTLADGSLIAMDAPPSKEDCRPFVAVAAYLGAMQVNAPKILASDLERGFLLMSDLGECQYLEQLSSDPDSSTALYGDAIATLLEMQRLGTRYQSKLPRYDDARLLNEMSLFWDWLCGRHLGLSFSEDDERAWRQTCRCLVDSAVGQPRVFVHRDYHSRNLMVREVNNPGVLDFQDAMEGPLTYDLVSLLKDCYIAWPLDRVREWALGYYERLPQEVRGRVGGQDEFLRFFDLMGVQRHLKAAGIFARLRHRDGKPAYLADVPRTLGYISELADRYDELAFLVRLVDTRVLPALEAFE